MTLGLDRPGFHGPHARRYRPFRARSFVEYSQPILVVTVLQPSQLAGAGCRARRLGGHAKHTRRTLALTRMHKRTRTQTQAKARAKAQTRPLSRPPTLPCAHYLRTAVEGSLAESPVQRRAASLCGWATPSSR